MALSLKLTDLQSRNPATLKQLDQEVNQVLEKATKEGVELRSLVEIHQLSEFLPPDTRKKLQAFLDEDIRFPNQSAEAQKAFAERAKNSTVIPVSEQVAFPQDLAGLVAVANEHIEAMKKNRPFGAPDYNLYSTTVTASSELELMLKLRGADTEYLANMDVHSDRWDKDDKYFQPNEVHKAEHFQQVATGRESLSRFADIAGEHVTDKVSKRLLGDYSEPELFERDHDPRAFKNVLDSIRRMPEQGAKLFQVREPRPSGRLEKEFLAIPTDKPGSYQVFVFRNFWNDPNLMD